MSEIQHQSDVIVCGGGPAGVMAAIASARSGAVTQLIESAGCLGGVWTSGLLSWIIDTHNKSGLLQELMARLEAQKACLDTKVSHQLDKGPQGTYAFSYDAEVLKLILDDMCLEAGVRVRCYTRVVDVTLDGRRVKGVITESESGREVFEAHTVIDASGSGYVGMKAGCKFVYGNEVTQESQPMTMLCLLSGINWENIQDYHRFRRQDQPEVKGHSWDQKISLHELIKTQGVSTSYGHPTLFLLSNNLMCLMANHEYGMKGIDAQDLTTASQNGRRELHTIVAALQSLKGPWENIKLVATASHIGVRDGRRITGRYQVSSEDARVGIRHDDAVCRVHFGIDVHAMNPKKNKGIDLVVDWSAQPYDIPLRSLIAKDVDGLMMAGRCISGDFIAHSSYRVTGDAAALGQAAGLAAAACAQQECLPHELVFSEVAERREQLIETIEKTFGIQIT